MTNIRKHSTGTNFGRLEYKGQTNKTLRLHERDTRMYDSGAPRISSEHSRTAQSRNLRSFY